jgi:tRNA dimethylallyltransferase
MDIGTAKPSSSTRFRIPHRMIDIADPSEDLNAKWFQEIGRNAISAALESHGRVIIVGGSGLHFRALVDPLTFAPADKQIRTQLSRRSSDDLRASLIDVDPNVSDHIDLDNPRRVIRALEILELTGEAPSMRATSPEAEAVRNYRSVIDFTGFGVDTGKWAGDRVVDRFSAMLDAGLLREVERLAPSMGRTASQAVGYKELLPVVAGEDSLATATQLAIGATNALVKRQRTFFGRDPRIAWLPWQDDGERRVENAAHTIGEAVQWTS